MGNQDSKRAMLLACDSVSVYPGGEISGHIYIRLDKSIKHKSKLFLVFAGNEFVQWNLGIIDSHKEKKKIDKSSKELYCWEGGLKKGQYDFPFAFVVSEELLPSFIATDENREAKIEYYLHSVLLSKGFKMKNSVNIEVMTRAYFNRVPVGIYKDMKIKSCCKMNEIQVKGQLNSNAFLSNENITYEFTYNTSNSSLGINDICVQLVRKLSIKNSSGNRNVSIKVLLTRRHEKVRKLTSESGLVTGTFALAKMTDDLAKSKSINSSLITCKYFVIIKHATDGSCKTFLEDIENEVEIYSNSTFIAAPNFNSPDNWNPQKFPLARMTFKEFSPSAPELIIEDNE